MANSNQPAVNGTAPQAVKLGLFGFGVVGQGLHGVLHETRGLHAEVAEIVVKHPSKPRPLPLDRFKFDPAAILNRPDLNLVVEMIDNADEAFEIVSTALKNGKAVVTANKKMVAEHLAELVQLQQQTGQPVLYEAAVAGSIPILRNLEEYYDNDLLSAVEGIVNGTCNYILSRMYNEGAAFEEVLRAAQAAGFAESDPTLDIDGYDAKYKLVILVGHAYGVFLAPEDVLNVGIRQVSPAEFQFAREKGYKLQLVSTSRKLGDDRFTAFVLPQFVPQGHLLYGIDAEYNGVIVEASFAQRQFFVGKGAGGYPTASAVLSDISARTYGYQYGYKKAAQPARPVFTTDVPLRLYLRPATGSAALEGLPLQQVLTRHESPDHSYLIADVRLGDLLPLADRLRAEQVFLALMPDQPGLRTPVAQEAAVAVGA